MYKKYENLTKKDSKEDIFFGYNYYKNLYAELYSKYMPLIYALETLIDEKINDRCDTYN